MKLYILGLFFAVAVTTNAFPGEWDYVPNISLRYVKIQTEEEYRAGASELGNNLRNFAVRLSKLPNEVSQAIWNELGSYNLDVGDVFMFTCGYEYTRPKMIVASIRITRINRDGTYNWVFYAWQAL